MFSRGNVPPMFYRILSKFPQNFSFCFAYGSGVKSQLGYENVARKKQNMIDLIFCVDNSYRWHADNLAKNPTHYSSLKHLGSNAIARYQENFGAKVYFNTLIPIEEENVLIKYGVISTADLLSDLLDWRYLYIAGRLHKPVEIIKNAANSKIQDAIDKNLRSAVHTALLLLPEKFTEYELYHKISSLSYNGDFRMIFGENKDKVKNIVKPQLESFRNLYAPTTDSLDQYLSIPCAGANNILCAQDKSETAKLHHYIQLPRWPVRYIVNKWNRGRYGHDTEDILRIIAQYSHPETSLRKALEKIVWHSSIEQSIKNIPTAGIIKSANYSYKKILKTFS